MKLSAQIYELPAYKPIGPTTSKTIQHQLSFFESPVSLDVIVADSLIIWGGDMILGSQTEALPPNAMAVVLSKQEYIWPYGVIPYVPPANDHPCRASIIAAMKEYQQRTNICFRERTTEDVYISFGSKNCNSTVGYIQKSYIVNVGTNCGCNALHELGHAIGLWHEHQSPQRDNFIEIQKQNIPNEEIYKTNYSKLDESNSYVYTPYDIFSVMHYPAKAKYNGNTVEIIKCKNGTCPNEMGYPKHLSALDVIGIKNIYPSKRASKISLQPL